MRHQWQKSSSIFHQVTSNIEYSLWCERYWNFKRAAKVLSSSNRPSRQPTSGDWYLAPKYVSNEKKKFFKRIFIINIGYARVFNNWQRNISIMTSGVQTVIKLVYLWPSRHFYILLFICDLDFTILPVCHQSFLSLAQHRTWIFSSLLTYFLFESFHVVFPGGNCVIPLSYHLSDYDRHLLFKIHRSGSSQCLKTAKVNAVGAVQISDLTVSCALAFFSHASQLKRASWVQSETDDFESAISSERFLFCSLSVI